MKIFWIFILFYFFFGLTEGGLLSKTMKKAVKLAKRHSEKNVKRALKDISKVKRDDLISKKQAMKKDKELFKESVNGKSLHDEKSADEDNRNKKIHEKGDSLARTNRDDQAIAAKTTSALSDTSSKGNIESSSDVMIKRKSTLKNERNIGGKAPRRMRDNVDDYSKIQTTRGREDLSKERVDDETLNNGVLQVTAEENQFNGIYEKSYALSRTEGDNEIAVNSIVAASDAVSNIKINSRSDYFILAPDIKIAVMNLLHAVEIKRLSTDLDKDESLPLLHCENALLRFVRDLEDMIKSMEEATKAAGRTFERGMGDVGPNAELLKNHHIQAVLVKIDKMTDINDERFDEVEYMTRNRNVGDMQVTVRRSIDTWTETSLVSEQRIWLLFLIAFACIALFVLQSMMNLTGKDFRAVTNGCIAGNSHDEVLERLKRLEDKIACQRI